MLCKPCFWLSSPLILLFCKSNHDKYLHYSMLYICITSYRSRNKSLTLKNVHIYKKKKNYTTAIALLPGGSLHLLSSPSVVTSIHYLYKS